MTEALTNWITTAIAIVALFLSVLSLYFQRRDKRGRLVISLSIKKVGLPIPRGDEGILNVEVPTLVVHLANPGETPVNVRKVELHGKSFGVLELAEHHAVQMEFAKPFTVEPQDGHDLHIRGQTLLNKLSSDLGTASLKAKVHASDELGNVHKSKTLEIQVEQLRETA